MHTDTVTVTGNSMRHKRTFGMHTDTDTVTVTGNSMRHKRTFGMHTDTVAVTGNSMRHKRTFGMHTDHRKQHEAQEDILHTDTVTVETA